MENIYPNNPLLFLIVIVLAGLIVPVTAVWISNQEELSKTYHLTCRLLDGTILDQKFSNYVVDDGWLKGKAVDGHWVYVQIDSCGIPIRKET